MLLVYGKICLCVLYIYVRYFRMYLAGILNFDLENKAKIHNMLMCLFYNKFFKEGNSGRYILSFDVTNTNDDVFIQIDSN